MASLWISTLEERTKTVGWLIFIYVILSNTVFLAWWFHNYFGFLKKKLRSISIFVAKRFSLKKNIQTPKKIETVKNKKEIETQTL